MRCASKVASWLILCLKRLSKLLTSSPRLDRKPRFCDLCKGIYALCSKFAAQGPFQSPSRWAADLRA